MIDARELADALNRDLERFPGMKSTGTIPIYVLYNILKEISGRDLLWTYHENSAFRFKVQKIHLDKEV